MSLNHNHNNKNGGLFYFLNKSNANYQGVGTTNAVRDVDGGTVVEDIPVDSHQEEFAPRPIGQLPKKVSEVMSPSSSLHRKKPLSWKALFGGASTNGTQQASPLPPSHPKPRKAPIKIEPKVFFANERTFLAWMHLSVILAGASIAIMAFADTADSSGSRLSQLYGILLLPVAIAFIVYSMVQYQRRSYMIRHRLPGPYEDTVGPVVLCTMLMISIVVQFALKLYRMRQEEGQMGL